MRISKKSSTFAPHMKKKQYIYPEMEIISLTGLLMEGMAGGSYKGEPDGSGAPPRTAVF